MYGRSEEDALLTLYHYWSSICSQKARFCLAEKKIPWQSRHVDIFAFENYADWYTRLNPKNVVPTLDHDRRIVVESNVILEYLQEAYPEIALRPDDARATMRLWVYNSEEMAHWNVNRIEVASRCWRAPRWSRRSDGRASPTGGSASRRGRDSSSAFKNPDQRDPVKR